MELSELVNKYRQQNARMLESELDYFRNLPTLDATIEAATMANGPDGVMLPHQRRIGTVVLGSALSELRQHFAEIEKCTHFDELYKFVKKTAEGIHGFGPLTVYDTALRIGARLNLLPQEVYLHAGARKGAKMLGIGGSQRVLPIGYFPKPLQELEPHHIEHFLCHFRNQLRRDMT